MTRENPDFPGIVAVSLPLAAILRIGDSLRRKKKPAAAGLLFARRGVTSVSAPLRASPLQ